MLLGRGTAAEMFFSHPPFLHCAGNNKTQIIFNYSWPVSIANPAALCSCLCSVAHINLLPPSLQARRAYVCVCIFLHKMSHPLCLCLRCTSFPFCAKSQFHAPFCPCLSRVFVCLCAYTSVFMCVCVYAMKREKARRVHNGPSCYRHLGNNQRVSAQFPV